MFCDIRLMLRGAVSDFFFIQISFPQTPSVSLSRYWMSIQWLHFSCGSQWLLEMPILICINRQCGLISLELFCFVPFKYIFEQSMRNAWDNDFCLKGGFSTLQVMKFTLKLHEVWIFLMKVLCIIKTQVSSQVRRGFYISFEASFSSFQGIFFSKQGSG